MAARLQATRVAWFEMGGFWTSRAPKGLKRTIFINKVQGAAVSGLTSYDWSRRESYAIDALLVNYLRVLVRGAFLRKSAGT